MKDTRNPHKCAEIIRKTGRPRGHKGSYAGKSGGTHYFQCRRCFFIYPVYALAPVYTQNKRALAADDAAAKAAEANDMQYRRRYRLQEVA